MKKSKKDKREDSRDDKPKGGTWWWETSKDDPADTCAGLMFSHVDAMRPVTSMRQEVNAENARMYWGKSVYGLGQYRELGSFVTASGQQYSITENGIASVVQTAESLIAADQPRASFLTEGAEWSAQRQAKKREQFVAGLYDKMSLYPLGVSIFRDACIFGDGVVKVYAGEDGPIVERVLIDDILVDEQEARDCSPRTLYQRRWVDRGVLKALYPEHAEAIGRGRTMGGRNASSNLVEVVEGWHLSSESGSHESSESKTEEDSERKSGGCDGMYAVCIAGKTLRCEEWDKPYFPFVFYKWDEPITGFYAQGLVEPLTLLQMDLNAIGKFIRRVQRAIIRPDIYGKFNQRMPDAFFENGVGRFFQTSDGRPPTFYTPQALNAETYNERERIVARMYALAGVGEQSAKGVKQPGLDSGVAIREARDIQGGRFGPKMQRFERFHMQLAERLIWAMKDVKDGSKVSVAFRAKKFATTIKWSDVDPGEDPFHVSIQASSLVSHTPAGKRQEAMDFLQLGIIDKAEFRHLCDMPDTQRSMDMNDVAYQYAEYAIEECCEGRFVRPEPFEDLTLCVKLTQYARLKYKLDGAPDDVLELLQMRIDMAVQMLEDLKTPPEMPPGDPMAAMGGAPVDPMMAAGGGMPGAPPQGVVPGAPLPGPGSPLPEGMV